MHRVIHTNIYKIGEYGTHLKNLSPEDKVSRFGYVIKNENIDNFILDMVYHHHDHELWYVMKDDKRVGWGHMAKDHNGVWEMALSVEKDYQNQGIGNALMTEMIAWAKFQQIEKFYMHCVEHNRPVQQLALKHGLITQHTGNGERTALMEVPPPSLIETGERLWKESTKLISDFSKFQSRLKYLWTLPILPKSVD